MSGHSLNEADKLPGLLYTVVDLTFNFTTLALAQLDLLARCMKTGGNPEGDNRSNTCNIYNNFLKTNNKLVLNTNRRSV